MAQQTQQQKMSKNIKKGISIIVIGLAIVVIGTAMSVNQQSGIMVGGWILDILGVILGLYGFGYIVATLKK